MMNNDNSTLGYVFRVLGEATAIVLLSCGTSFCIMLQVDPKSSPPSVVGVCGYGGVLLALIWFIARLLILSSPKYGKLNPSRKTTKISRHYELMRRADLKHIAVPSTKQKKRKNDVANNDSVYLIRGRGTQATDPVDMDSGMYRLAYQFTPGVSTTVKLIQCLNGEEQVLLTRVSGTGSQTFTVTEADRYLFQVVVPVAQTPAWKIEVERL